MSIADAQLIPVRREQEVRVRLGEGGKRRVVNRGKGPKRSIHEVGDGRGLADREL